MQPKSVLISGAGVAGLTLAFWLKKYGYDPVIIEKAPALRTGGYMIDFWGAGFEVASKMNLLHTLGQYHYYIPELEFVNKNGQRISGFNVEKLRKLMHYRHFNLLRGNLVKVLYGSLQPAVEIMFGNSVVAFQENEDQVQVTFENGASRNFDLVVGADGLHSAVRKLAFGPEASFEKALGYYVCSFTIDNFTGKDHIFQSYTKKGKWAGIYSITQNQLATFFIYKSADPHFPHHDVEAQQNLLRENFKGMGWYCPALLQKMVTAPDFYFDSVSQIIMPRWHKNRIVLLGDASYCVSPIAGKGASLAMAGAYILAGELKNAGGDFELAFNRYEQKMRPEVARAQKLGQDLAPSFVPDSAFGIWKRNFFTSLMRFTPVSRWFINHYLSEKMQLENY